MWHASSNGLQGLELNTVCKSVAMAVQHDEYLVMFQPGNIAFAGLMKRLPMQLTAVPHERSGSAGVVS